MSERTYIIETVEVIRRKGVAKVQASSMAEAVKTLIYDSPNGLEDYCEPEDIKTTREVERTDLVGLEDDQPKAL